MMVEVAGGATLSLVYENLLKETVPNLTENSTVVLIVCGGKASTTWYLMTRIECPRGISNGIKGKVWVIIKEYFALWR